MKRLLPKVLIVFLFCFAGLQVFCADSPPKESGAFGMLVKQLADKAKVKDKSLKVAVGDFPCATPGSPGISTLSRVLHDKFSEATAAYSGFKLISRDRLGDLIKERKLQSMDIINPDARLEPVSISGIDAIIRGHYLLDYPNLTIRAELVMLNGGRTFPVTKTFPVDRLKVNGLFPPQSGGDIDTRYLLPPNVENSWKNFVSVAAIGSAIHNHDIKLKIWTKSGRTDFADGDKIHFNIMAERNCYVAIIDHFSDGGSVLLFPNRFSKDNFVQAKKVFSVPGNDRQLAYFLEISPPFGSDIVQVIACDHKEELNKLLAGRKTVKGIPFYNLDREKFLSGVKGASSAWNKTDKPEGQEQIVPAFGEATLKINTFPRKPGNNIQ